LERNGIQVLRNRALPLPGVAGWFIAGLESYWGGRPDPRFLRKFPEDARFISIVHEPDAWDQLRDPRIRLQVSGHTHGGQVCMPFWGALTLPSWGKLYSAGLYGSGDRHLYVSRGLGTVNMRVRFCCRPEITVFELS
jgi:predicted MPP superfamily phosphohydrolase